MRGPGRRADAAVTGEAGNGVEPGATVVDLDRNPMAHILRCTSGCRPARGAAVVVIVRDGRPVTASDR
jgi:hypothetical protein